MVSNNRRVQTITGLPFVRSEPNEMFTHSRYNQPSTLLIVNVAIKGWLWPWQEISVITMAKTRQSNVIPQSLLKQMAVIMVALLFSITRL